MFGLEEEADEDYIENSFEIENDVENFEASEQQLQEQFGTAKYLRCAAHTMQCSLRSLDKVPTFNALKSSALKLNRKFQKSSTATCKLKNLCNRRLIPNSNTRWNVMCLVFERMIEVQSHIATVCAELGWDNLTNTEWAKVNIFLIYDTKVSEL